MKALELQHGVTRTRVKGCKLLEFRVFQWPLWIRRVLVDPNRPPSAASPGGAMKPGNDFGRAGFAYRRPLLSGGRLDETGDALRRFCG
jgi:hypothetical protein